MATNWTDATLFIESDVILPSILADVTTKNYHDFVKDELRSYIVYKFKDYANFDIEEISNVSTLKQAALYRNLAKIAEEVGVTYGETNDAFVDYHDFQIAHYNKRIKQDMASLTFSAPESINDRKNYSIQVTR